MTRNSVALGRAFAAVLAAAWLVALGGCAGTYVTPGGAVNLQSINEYDIKERFQVKPAASFPARLALVRVQGTGYSSFTVQGHGQGRFSVVTARDVEKDEHFDKLAAMPGVSGLATINRLLLPDRLESLKDLRLACASLHADIMLVYTFDTVFNVNSQDLGPLTVITLGFLPNKMARVTTTVSGLLVDVRTGYVYGVSEASHSSSHLASSWSKDAAVDKARVDTERGSFAKFVDNTAATWKGVVKEYGQKEGGASKPSVDDKPAPRGERTGTVIDPQNPYRTDGKGT